MLVLTIEVSVRRCVPFRFSLSLSFGSSSKGFRFPTDTFCLLFKRDPISDPAQVAVDYIRPGPPGMMSSIVWEGSRSKPGHIRFLGGQGGVAQGSDKGTPPDSRVRTTPRWQLD